MDGYDWRSDLVKAVHNVFMHDNASILADLQSYRLSSGASVEELEQRIHNLVSKTILYFDGHLYYIGLEIDWLLNTVSLGNVLKR